MSRTIKGDINFKQADVGRGCDIHFQPYLTKDKRWLNKKAMESDNSLPVIVSMPGKWTKEWPTKPGAYWFYGYRHGRDGLKGEKGPQYHFVEVRETSNKVIVHLIDGMFIYPSVAEEAWFMEMDVTEPPEDFKE